MTNKFECPKWEESVFAEADGVKVAHAQSTYLYEGRLEGEGLCQALLTYLPDGTGTYVGTEMFTGKIDGRAGTVVFQHNGTFDAAGITGAWTVAPGTGTGDLAGGTGSGSVTMAMGTQSSGYTFTS
jgi:hypothetical protein